MLGCRIEQRQNMMQYQYTIIVKRQELIVQRTESEQF